LEGLLLHHSGITSSRRMMSLAEKSSLSCNKPSPPLLITLGEQSSKAERILICFRDRAPSYWQQEVKLFF